jgi:hypothetical protein
MTGSPCAAGDQAAEVHLLLLAYNYGPPVPRSSPRAARALSHMLSTENRRGDIFVSESAMVGRSCARGSHHIRARGTSTKRSVALPETKIDKDCTRRCASGRAATGGCPRRGASSAAAARWARARTWGDNAVRIYLVITITTY